MNLLQKTILLKQIMNGNAEQHWVNELNALEQKLQEQRLYVVVVGFFKRGKSTLINALLEKQVAPVAITPLTALVSVIDYDENPHVMVYFMNGKSLQTTIEHINEYVTEDENPENKKQVNYVRILDNSPVLKNVSLVDTPGLGSAYEHNTEATLAFIPRIDAALFILSADIPVSKTDLELLKVLSSSAPKIIYVFNKADLLDEADLQKITEHNKAVIAKTLQIPKEEINMLIVSGKKGDISCLKNTLLSLSDSEKESLLHASSSNQINLLRSKAVLQTKLKRDAFLMPLNELAAKQVQLNASIQLMQEQKDEFESVIAGKIKLLQDNIHEAVNAESKMLSKTISERIENINTINEEYLKNLQDELNKFILAGFENAKHLWEQKAKEHFKNLLQQYSQRSQTFFHELSANFSSYFGQGMDIISEQFDLNIYTSFYLSLDSGLPPLKRTSSFFEKMLSPSSQKNNLKKKWRQHYEEIRIRNTASIIYDLTYKIQESFRKFNYDLNNKMNDLLSTMKKSIEEVIESKTKAEEQNEGEIKVLKNRLMQLEALEM